MRWVPTQSIKGAKYPAPSRDGGCAMALPENVNQQRRPLSGILKAGGVALALGAAFGIGSLVRHAARSPNVDDIAATVEAAPTSTVVMPVKNWQTGGYRMLVDELNEAGFAGLTDYRDQDVMAYTEHLELEKVSGPGAESRVKVTFPDLNGDGKLGEYAGGGYGR